jgi:hypothetical protein
MAICSTVGSAVPIAWLMKTSARVDSVMRSPLMVNGEPVTARAICTCRPSGVTAMPIAPSHARNFVVFATVIVGPAVMVAVPTVYPDPPIGPRAANATTCVPGTRTASNSPV